MQKLFIIRINGGFHVNYFLFWKVELFPFFCELFPPTKQIMFCININWKSTEMQIDKTNEQQTNKQTEINQLECAARFMDNEWYRAEVQQVQSQDSFLVHYLDYGNSLVLTQDKMARLPDQLASLPAQAKEFQLALTTPSDDVSD